MNKAELVEKTAKASGLSKKDANVLINALFDGSRKGVISSELRAHRKVTIPGFGTFETRRLWNVRNPEAQGPKRTQSSDWRGNQNQSQDRPGFSCRQGIEGQRGQINKPTPSFHFYFAKAGPTSTHREVPL